MTKIVFDNYIVIEVSICFTLFLKKRNKASNIIVVDLRYLL